MKGSILSHSDADIKDTEVIDINNKLNLNLKLLLGENPRGIVFLSWYFYFHR